MSYWDELQPASFRGVSFSVQIGSATFGRRLALHEYPYRDKPWPEDLGRRPRRFRVYGFLVGDDVIAQRGAMVAAAETKGTGTLVHPTYGALTVSVETFEVRERWDQGRVFELEFEFIEGGLRIFPAAANATGSQVTTAAAAADSACGGDFVTATVTPIALGAPVIAAGSATAGLIAGKIVGLCADASNLFDEAATLVGSYGRYVGEALVGGLTSAVGTIVPAQTLDDLIAVASAAQETVASAADAFLAVIAMPAQAAAALQGLVAALLGTCADPAGGIRLLATLAIYTPPAGNGLAPIGQAIAALQGALGDLGRRAAVTALARAAQTYQPSSANDATAVRAAVCGLLDAEITIAGDQGEDASYLALRALRTAVSQDLTARGANLAPIVTFSFGASLPALNLAWRLYQDISRTDGLITQVDPPHPAFMPTSFSALAS